MSLSQEPCVRPWLRQHIDYKGFNSLRNLFDTDKMEFEYDGLNSLRFDGTSWTAWKKHKGGPGGSRWLNEGVNALTAAFKKEKIDKVTLSFAAGGSVSGGPGTRKRAPSSADLKVEDSKYQKQAGPTAATATPAETPATAAETLATLAGEKTAEEKAAEERAAEERAAEAEAAAVKAAEEKAVEEKAAEEKAEALKAAKAAERKRSFEPLRAAQEAAVRAAQEAADAVKAAEDAAAAEDVADALKAEEERAAKQAAGGKIRQATP